MKLLKHIKLLSSSVLLKMSNFNSLSTPTSSSSSIASRILPQFKVLDINTLDNNEYYNIFSYGSNSISQLRGRTLNNSLVSQAAYVKDIIRIFVLKGWGESGVASLHPLKDEYTQGSVVSMSLDDLVKLNIYEEENYELCEIEVYADDKKINALTFIAKDPAFSKTPSEEYCVAIYKHLKENNHQIDTLPIYGVNPETNTVEKKATWTHPGIPNLSIPGLFVEVNVERINRSATPWIMPRQIYDIETILDKININTVDDLQVAIHQENLNQLLKDTNLQEFDDVTISILESFFSDNPASTDIDFSNDNAEHYCFVYGSLLSNLSNHYFLKDHHTTEFIG